MTSAPILTESFAANSNVDFAHTKQETIILAIHSFTDVTQYQQVINKKVERV